MATRALVVGGTGGIGYAMACRIAAEAKSSTVVISGRTKPAQMPHSNMEFRQLDASSMQSIKAYTDHHKTLSNPHLDLLILSQGILTTAGRTETPEGIDRKMALHYYGRQLLIRELKPVLAPDAKVVIVLDSVRGSPDKLTWDDLDLKTHYSLASAGNHCMSMNDAMIQFYAAEEARMATSTTTPANKRHYVHAFPGVVKTEIFRSLPWYLRPAAAAASVVLGVAPDVSAERLLAGTRECAEAGRSWSCIDDKGRLLEGKAVWNDDQLQKVADHTWKIVDGALGNATAA